MHADAAGAEPVHTKLAACMVHPLTAEAPTTPRVTKLLQVPIMRFAMQIWMWAIVLQVCTNEGGQLTTPDGSCADPGRARDAASSACSGQPRQRQVTSASDIYQQTVLV
jgi:hypothetical protein